MTYSQVGSLDWMPLHKTMLVEGLDELRHQLFLRDGWTGTRS